MLFVLLACHSANNCPLANATTRDLILRVAPDFPNLAQKAGVELVAGPFVNREHLVTVVVQADRAENVDSFLHDSHLDQWNSIRVVPSLTMEEGLAQIEAATPIF